VEHRHGDAVVAVEVPLLFEAGWQNQFDVVVLVEADRQLQKNRIMGRDKATAEASEALLNLHVPAEKKRAWADHVVENVGTIGDIRPAIAQIYRKILEGL
jgi:dephospho-CoA kinase